MSKVSDLLKPISPDIVGAYLNSTIQLHELIEWALRQSGKSDITIVSFSISEEFIRKMWMLKETGFVGEITLVMDIKAREKIEKIMPFAEKVFSKIYFSKIHAKVVLIEAMKLCIIGSQNCTRGNREESGIITNQAKTYDTFCTEINRIKKNAVQRK